MHSLISFVFQLPPLNSILDSWILISRSQPSVAHLTALSYRQQYMTATVYCSPLTSRPIVVFPSASHNAVRVCCHTSAPDSALLPCHVWRGLWYLFHISCRARHERPMLPSFHHCLRVSGLGTLLCSSQFTSYRLYVYLTIVS